MTAHDKYCSDIGVADSLATDSTQKKGEETIAALFGESVSHNSVQKLIDGIENKKFIVDYWDYMI